MTKKNIIFFFFFIISSLFSKEVDYLSLGLGCHNILREKYRTAEFSIEYQSHRCLWKIHPFLGVMITARKSLYTYLGVGVDLLYKNHLLFSPNFSAGYYYKGNGRDLGYPLEFRSGIKLGWCFENLSRVGIQFYHISNASLSHRNPGSESLVLFYSIPLKIY